MEVAVCNESVQVVQQNREAHVSRHIPDGSTDCPLSTCNWGGQTPKVDLGIDLA